jgi:predicted small metal-binding protein
MAVEFRCADVGVACNAKTTADTPAALVEKVAAHAKDTHGVELNQTLIDYAVTEVRASDSTR